MVVVVPHLAHLVAVVVEAHMAVVVEAVMLPVVVHMVEVELQARYVLYGLDAHEVSQVLV
jgi:hypothetical protein